MANPAHENGDINQLVTFRLGKELYGVDIFKVKEVLHYREVTVIPNAPEFVDGVIDLRGKVIPIVDFKKRLGVNGEGTGKKRIVILDLARPLGLIVDDISKVLLLEQSDYESLPETAIDEHEKDCILKLAKTDDGNLIIVISPEKILTHSEKAALGDLEGIGKEGRKEQVDVQSSNRAS